MSTGQHVPSPKLLSKPSPPPSYLLVLPLAERTGLFSVCPLRELRALVIEMVLATDMSCHFQQVKTMKTALQQLER